MLSRITKGILILSMALVPWVSSANAAEPVVNKTSGDEIAHWYWRGGGYNWGPRGYYYPRYYYNNPYRYYYYPRYW